MNNLPSFTISKRQIGDYSIWGADSWWADGIAHGFMGAEFNAIEDNLQFISSVGPVLGFKQLLLLNQVHKTAIVDGDYSFPASVKGETKNSCAEGDGWFLKVPENSAAYGFAYGIKTADCVPVLILDRFRKFGMALHCGWRGTVNGIVDVAIRKFRSLNVEAKDLEVLIGPAARSCCYEIGPEVVVDFERVARELQIDFHEILGDGKNEKTDHKMVDVPKLLQLQLLKFGVPLSHQVLLPLCTVCDHRFFSFRRQGDCSGRQLTFIVG